MRDRLSCAALLLFVTSVVQGGNTKEPPRYRIEKLEGILGFPTDINRHGAITGTGFVSPINGPFNVPYLWTRKSSMLLIAEPPTVTVAGNGVNDKGQVAGTLVGFDPRRTSGFVWTRGRFVEIGDLPGGNTVSAAEAINNAGQVAGESDSAQGTECILWESGNLMSIGDLPGGRPNCEALGINNSAEIVGIGGTDRGNRPFLWREGTMTELPLPPIATSGFASGLNNHGVVVGNFDIGFASAGALVWTNGTSTQLAGLEGLHANAKRINDRGDIVGSAGDRTGPALAVLWHQGVPMNLMDLIPDDDPLKTCTELFTGEDINNRGEIAAAGADLCSDPVGEPTIFRLVPIKGRK